MVVTIIDIQIDRYNMNNNIKLENSYRNRIVIILFYKGIVNV